VWASAWLVGAAAPDDVLDALAPWADAHDVQAADDAAAARHRPAAAGRPGESSLPFLMAALRRAAPAAPPASCCPHPATSAASPGLACSAARPPRAGEGVLFADVGLGVVPAPIADGVVRWTVYRVPEPGPTPEFVALTHAERDLRDQVRQSASVLTDLGVARHRPGVREEIAASLRARPATLWPAGMPAQALRVLQHADEVEAILSAASVDEPGGALSARRPGPGAKLRPLRWPSAWRARRCRAVRVVATSPLV
jgi:hypothetical protein